MHDPLEESTMNVVDAIAHAMKAEGIDTLFAYPVNPLIEAAAKLDIRTVIVRQERIGLHMADAYSRLSSGDKIGVFCMQHGPGGGKRFWRCRSGLLRIGSHSGHSGRLPAPLGPLLSEL
jgi:glyoxylate carboligase